MACGNKVERSGVSEPLILRMVHVGQELHNEISIALVIDDVMAKAVLEGHRYSLLSVR